MATPSVPIIDVNPFLSLSSVRGRCIGKSVIRQWSKPGSTGKAFDLRLFDSSGTIKINVFNENVQRLYDAFKMGDVYEVSNFIVKPARPQYSGLSHPYEIHVKGATTVNAYVGPEDGLTPALSYNFTKIVDIERCSSSAVIDVVGVLKRQFPVQTIRSKRDLCRLKRRLIVLVDDANIEIPCTLWADRAMDFNVDNGTVIGLSVNDFNGRGPNILPSTNIAIDPKIDQRDHLVDLYTRFLPPEENREIPWRMLENVEANTVVQHSNGMHFKYRVWVMDIEKENVVYKSCAVTGCGRKCQDLGNEQIFCPQCKMKSCDFHWRLLLHVSYDA